MSVRGGSQLTSTEGGERPEKETSRYLVPETCPAASRKHTCSGGRVPRAELDIADLKSASYL
jgi:hypothetical protein